MLQGETQKPFPQWGNIELITTDASANYHGPLTKVEKRFSQGLTFLGTYTWSKTMFDSFAGNGADRHNSPFDLNANQEVETCKMQKSAQDQRTETEKAKGTADMQADLAKSQVGVEI